VRKLQLRELNAIMSLAGSWACYVIGRLKGKELGPHVGPFFRAALTPGAF